MSAEQLGQLLMASCALTEPGADPPRPPESSEEVEVIAECQERKIAQLQSLTQWHHDVCGHHALFNLRHETTSEERA